MVFGLDINVFIAVVGPTVLLFVTQIFALVWFLATVHAQHAHLFENLQRLERHTGEHCDELKEVNHRLIRLQAYAEEWDRWRTALDRRLDRLELGPATPGDD